MARALSSRRENRLETVLILRPHRMLVVCVLAATMAFGALPDAAQAAPSSAEVAARQVAVDEAVRAYTTAQARVQAADAAAAAASTRLDELIGALQNAQSRLGSHASASYRAGHITFLEVLTTSVNFETFSTRMALLRRINARDAAAIQEVKRARKRAVSEAGRLVILQERSAKELRAAQTATAKAKAALERDRDAYASYQRRITALRSRDPITPKPSPAPRTSKRAPAQPTAEGTGAWRTGKASHYGKGSWGHRTASGSTVRSDSMIVAHKTLPFGTLVEFRFNGKRAVARVADRGPYVAGRMWDLGPGIISVLGFNGVHDLQYRIIGR